MRGRSDTCTYTFCHTAAQNDSTPRHSHGMKTTAHRSNKLNYAPTVVARLRGPWGTSGATTTDAQGTLTRSPPPRPSSSPSWPSSSPLPSSPSSSPSSWPSPSSWLPAWLRRTGRRNEKGRRASFGRFEQLPCGRHADQDMADHHANKHRNICPNVKISEAPSRENRNAIAHRQTHQSTHVFPYSAFATV